VKGQGDREVDNVELLKGKVLLACKIYQSQGLLDGFGHVTLRLSQERILSTPKMPPGKVSMRDFIIVDTNGNKLDGWGEPNGETPMHTAIYKARPDVKCILHYHPDELIAASVVAQGIRVVANCGVFFHQGTPVFDSPELIVTQALGKRVADTLGDHNALLLRGHGATVVGGDLDELVRLGINLVKNVRIHIMATALGTPKIHSEAESRSVLEIETHTNALRRFVDYYVSEVVD
jgi:ribulose-5-phosphate 4-epimerase/fuculose-1-phosphate aldolase